MSSLSSKRGTKRGIDTTKSVSLANLFDGMEEYVPEKEDEKAKAGLLIWDVVNNIQSKKGGRLTEEEIGKAYAPFIINMALSNQQDTVLLANEMNSRWSLPPIMQYHFYYHSVSRRFRGGTWNKAEKGEDDKIELIKKIYQYNNIKAKEAVTMFNLIEENQNSNVWNELREMVSEGGI